MEEKDHIDAFRKTKYWNYLISRNDEIDKELQKFNNEFLTLLDTRTDEMALVLKCHLILEHYLDEYISAAFPTIVDVEKMNLRFSTKIEMINSPQTAFGLFYDSLKQLNRLRNKFAHNLEYRVLDTDVDKIALSMNTWNDALGNERTTGLALIRQFTMWFCHSLFSTKNDIEREVKELGIAGYIRWIREMNELES